MSSNANQSEPTLEERDLKKGVLQRLVARTRPRTETSVPVRCLHTLKKPQTADDEEEPRREDVGSSRFPRRLSGLRALFRATRAARLTRGSAPIA